MVEVNGFKDTVYLSWKNGTKKLSYTQALLEAKKMTAAVQICSLLLDIEETSALPFKKIWNAEKLAQRMTLNANQNIQDILLLMNNLHSR